MPDKSIRKKKKRNNKSPELTEQGASDINASCLSGEETNGGERDSFPGTEDHFTGEGVNNVKEITLEALTENIGRVTEFIDMELEAIGCPFKAQTQIDVAVDELFANIAHYAYGAAGGSATIQFEADDAGCVTVTFIDRGMPFNPLLNKDPDTTLSAEERKIGGLGIFLVKKTMDDMIYEYKDGQNILKIKKNIRR